MNLAETFPHLPFAGEADKFLRDCHGDNIAEQLRERHVSSIKMIPLAASNSGVGVGEDGELVIFINENLTIGGKVHELGYAFAQTFNDNMTLVEEVDFFRTFADRWIAINRPENIISFLRASEALVSCDLCGHIHHP